MRLSCRCVAFSPSGKSRSLLQSRSKNRLYPCFWTVQGSLRGAARSFRTTPTPVFFDLNVGLGPFLSILFLSINWSLSSLTPLTLWQSFNLWRRRHRQRRFEFPAAAVRSSSISIFSFFPPLSLRFLFLPSSIPILFAVSALVFCFPLGLNIYALD